MDPSRQDRSPLQWHPGPPPFRATPSGGCRPLQCWHQQRYTPAPRSCRPYQSSSHQSCCRVAALAPFHVVGPNRGVVPHDQQQLCCTGRPPPHAHQLHLLYAPDRVAPPGVPYLPAALPHLGGFFLSRSPGPPSLRLRSADPTAPPAVLGGNRVATAALRHHRTLPVRAQVLRLPLWLRHDAPPPSSNTALDRSLQVSPP